MAELPNRTEENERITRQIAEHLGLDPATVQRFTADWAGGDTDVVITWTGIKVLPMAEYRAMLEQIFKAREEERDGEQG